MPQYGLLIRQNLFLYKRLTKLIANPHDNLCRSFEVAQVRTYSSISGENPPLHSYLKITLRHVLSVSPILALARAHLLFVTAPWVRSNLGHVRCNGRLVCPGTAVWATLLIVQHQVCITSECHLLPAAVDCTAVRNRSPLLSWVKPILRPPTEIRI